MANLAYVQGQLENVSIGSLQHSHNRLCKCLNCNMFVVFIRYIPSLYVKLGLSFRSNSYSCTSLSLFRFPAALSCQLTSSSVLLFLSGRETLQSRHELHAVRRNSRGESCRRLICIWTGTAAVSQLTLPPGRQRRHRDVSETGHHLCWEEQVRGGPTDLSGWKFRVLWPEFVVFWGLSLLNMVSSSAQNLWRLNWRNTKSFQQKSRQVRYWQVTIQC